VDEFENQSGDREQRVRPAAREIIREPAREVRRSFFAFAFPRPTV